MDTPENLPGSLPERRASDLAPTVEGIALPSLVLAAGEEAARTFLEFFIASIRNRHTRRAYARQARDFLQWAGERGVSDVRQVRTEHAAAYLELLTRSGRETASVKQAREVAAPGGGETAGDDLGHDPVGLDAEAGGANLLELVVGGLAGGGDAQVGEGARHGRTRPERLPGTQAMSESLNS